MEVMRKWLHIFLAVILSTFVVEAAEPLESLSDSVYSLYVRNDISGWKPIIDSMHRLSPSSVDSLDFLLSLQYGYVAWCVSDTICKGADEALDAAFDDLDKFELSIETVPGKTVTRTMLESKARSYYSAFLAYQINLNAARAIINGWRSVSNAKGAVNAAPGCWFSQLEYGNVMHYMPTIMGGSKINARKAYNSAIKIMTDEHKDVRNWMFLHALLCLADCYKLEKDFDNVSACYSRALSIEPDFTLVRDSLVPSLARQK